MSDPIETLPTAFSPTAFERYLYWEIQPEHPNQITAVFDFEGAFDPQSLTASLAVIRQRHPMLTAKLVVRDGAPAYWTPGDDQRLPLNLINCKSGFSLDELPQLPAVNPAGDYTSCLTARYSSDRCQWILQTHHAATDGVGGLQVLRELLQLYAAEVSGSELELRLLPTDRLLQRERFVRSWSWKHWWKMPVSGLALFGASKFLFRSILALPDQTLHGPAEREVETAAPQDSQSLEHQLSHSQTRRLRQLSRQAGVTVNSLILAYWMVALDQWNNREGTLSDVDWYRLVIPTNQRQGRDIALSACNRVSMVYVDRQRHELEIPERLMHGIHYEMGVMRRLELTGTFLLAMKVMSRIPGLLKKHAQERRCWATSYVTNLGAALNRLGLPLEEHGRSRVGEMTLNRIRLLPPLRPGTPLALAVNQYAGRLSFTLHYRPGAITGKDARSILNYFLHRLKTLS